MAIDQPPILACVATSEIQRASLIVLSGSAADMAAFQETIQREHLPFEFSSSSKDDQGNLTAILRYSSDIPWKTIARLIYQAQAARLQMGGWTYNPPDCEK